MGSPFVSVMHGRALALGSCVALVACGGASASSAGGGGGGTGAGGGSNGAGGFGGASSCEAFGHFGKPKTTFVLPVVMNGSDKTLEYTDVQASFPDVDWAHLDRLYLPAGTYKSLELGNLPTRDPATPLVITNQGGQVVVGFNPMGNYIWSMSGGAGWVLTGRYDPDSKTGDPKFPGHRCGNYANSADTYGLVSDDDYALEAPYLHMGLAVTEATKFQIEYVEVRRSGFAGIRLLNARAAGDPSHPMENVRINDVYVHDTAGEGFYFGWTGDPPSNELPGLEISNVRILRTGNEALQIQDLGDGTYVHDSVFANGGLHWLDNGLGLYQDNDSQIQTREGTIRFEHDVFLDGASTISSFWSQPEPGDGERHVTFNDNFFADTLSLAIYFGGTSDAGSSFTFSSNFFSGIVNGYQRIQPGPPPTAIMGMDPAIQGAVLLENNHWMGSLALFDGIQGGAGTVGTVTAKSNVNGNVASIAFTNAGYPIDNPGHHMTSWAPNITVVSGSPVVTYVAGDVVTYGEAPDIYQCTAKTTAGPPPDHPEAWMKLPKPVDDVRVAASSPYAAMGVH